MRIVGLIFPDEAADKFRCPRCGKEYKAENRLVKHMKEDHPEIKVQKDEGE